MALSFKWTEEHDDLTHLIGDSETMPQVDPEILNIVDKGELNYWLSKFVVEVPKKKELLHVGTIFHPKSIILVDILKNVLEFLLTALLEIKFKLVGRRNFMSLETVKSQQELLRELRATACKYQISPDS